MIKIKLIALGKLKEGYLREASAEYEKRLSAFCKLEIIELNPVKLPDNPSKSQIDDALEREATEIKKKLSQNTKIYTMCIEGQMMSSEKFSEHIEKSAVSGNGNIAIIIGSSFGLSDTIKRESDLKLSLSPMTFPHQLARVMVLEQLYRAFCIQSGSKYHK